IPFDIVGATFVRLVNEHGELVLERRENGEWWLLEPKEIPADPNIVATLVDNLHASKKASEFKSDDLAAYGLDEPNQRITVEGDADGKSARVTLLLGDETPQLGRVYAM